MKRRVISVLLTVLMCASCTTTAFAKDKNSVLLSQQNAVYSESIANYKDTKAVAAAKASVLTSTYGATSVQYALIDNGKIVVSGNLVSDSKKNKTKVTENSIYGIGSISKVFVTTAIMNLVDKGKVKLDDPVTEYIKEFKMADERYKNITVRMLLNHSSGIMGTSGRNSCLLGDNDTYAHDTLLQRLGEQRLKADPGAYSVYCNDGFDLAQLIVERVTGMSYTSYLTENIMTPLKMDNTKTPQSTFDRNRLASTFLPGIENPLPAENANIIGAGGVYSTAEELCKFATTFTKDSNGILSKESIKSMENKEYLRGMWSDDVDNVLAYGLGWDSVNLYPFNQYNIKALMKGGDTLLYHSSLIVLPEENMAVAVTSSGSVSNLNELMAQEMLLAALKEKGTIKEIKGEKTFTKPQQASAPKEMTKYEGIYGTQVGFTKVKIDEAGILTLTVDQGGKEVSDKYIYTKDGVFVSENGDKRTKFVVERNGKIYMEQGGYVTVPQLGSSAFNLYMAQKVGENKIGDEVSKAWANRTGKKYYLMNEKYSSLSYVLFPGYMQINLTKEAEGYVRIGISTSGPGAIDKIVDKNLALGYLDAPGVLSRDLNDFNFYEKDNVEYIKSGDSILMSEDAIGTLSTEDKFKCTIGNDGYTKWYKIGDGSVNKEIIVDMPKDSSFVVYDSNGTLVNYSLVTGVNKVTLPKDGTIGFMGNATTVFDVQYNKTSK